MVYVAIGALFGLSQSVMLAFPLERPIFLREYSTGTYGSVPYVLSKILVEVPMAIAQVQTPTRTPARSHSFLFFALLEAL